MRAAHRLMLAVDQARRPWRGVADEAIRPWSLGMSEWGWSVVAEWSGSLAARTQGKLAGKPPSLINVARVVSVWALCRLARYCVLQSERAANLPGGAKERGGRDRGGGEEDFRGVVPVMETRVSATRQLTRTPGQLPLHRAIHQHRLTATQQHGPPRTRATRQRVSRRARKRAGEQQGEQSARGTASPRGDATSVDWGGALGVDIQASGRC